MHHSERGAVTGSRTAERITRGLSLRVDGAVTRHDWPLTLPWAAETRRTWKAIAGFTEERACPRALEGDDS